MKKSDTFDLSMPDKHGFVPDHHQRYVGALAVHSGNGKGYRINGFAWMGATDEWGFLHHSPEGVMCVRPMHHLWGLRDDGTLRYHNEWEMPFLTMYPAPVEASAPSTQIERLDGPSPKVVASVTYPYDISVVPEHALARLERQHKTYADTLRYIYGDDSASFWQEILDRQCTPPWPVEKHYISQGFKQVHQLKAEYELLLDATADLTDAFLQVPDRVSRLQEHGDWIDRWAKPAICKIAKAVGHKATRCGETPKE